MYVRKLMKVGTSSTALVLDKSWIDYIKMTLNKKEISVKVYGKNFLLIEVEDLPINDPQEKKLLEQTKKILMEKEV